METVGGTATERVRLPPPWLRGGNVVPRIKSDDPYLQIVQPEGIVDGGQEGAHEVTTNEHDVDLEDERGVHTTTRNTMDYSPVRASVPGATEVPADNAAWLEDREDNHR